MKMHPGIRIDRIAPRGGPGLLFVLFVLVVALIALPETRPFVIASAAGGIVVAAILRLFR